jgi:sugar phosphate isomerase/epimerase
MKLSVSTLACPAWTLDQIIDGVAAAGAGGIDFRGVASEIDITRLPQFTTELPETLRRLGERSLRLPCFNLSTTLVTADAARWASFVDEVTRYATLARVTGTRFLRVFGGAVPSELSRGAAAELARGHLREIVSIARPCECQVVLESHDDWSTSAQVLELVGDFGADEVGVLWDIEHSVRGSESPGETVSRLGDRVRHVHVKDSRRVGDRNSPTLLGEGELPIAAAVRALRSLGYAGWYTLETEKRWRSEAPEPEESLPQFVAYMRGLETAE